MVGNIAQVYSPYLYDSSTGPRYLPAMIANSVFTLASIGIATILYFALKRENKKLDAESAERAVVEESEPSKPGAQHVSNIVDPEFRYIL